ncbi:macrophage scavenger receptor types I and II-like [Branchiostoma lanceolatum]|uniref:macrophage scavenger receptor types I and II-like n=1 Tax=Branchiostoma lanceolatum TaxID=7740 RepID=UPI0034549A0F
MAFPLFSGDTLTCEPCQPGYKCVNGDEVEEICPAGTQSRVDGTACDPCAVGEFSPADGSSTCQPCPAGQFNTESGLSSCDPCPAGQYSSSGSSACQPCPAGRFNTQSGSASCDPCPAGQHSPSDGSTSCQICPAGQFSPSGSSGCQLCPAGQHSTHSGSGSCDPCPAGQHSPSDGSTSCQVCAAGTYSPSGSSDCQVCPAGHLSSAGSASCYATIRLVGGSSASEGRVEVFHNGQWGTVCNDHFDQNLDGANVVCRQLGFARATEVKLTAVFGEGSDPIWLDDVICSGSETTIVNCNHLAWGEHNCSHHEDVGVVCS